MTIRTLISQMQSVEDLFSVLDVAYDENVVAVHRTRILRRFGQEMAALDAESGSVLERDVKEQYASALLRIHEQCARGMRDAVPVFRGVSQHLVQLRRGPRKE